MCRPCHAAYMRRWRKTHPMSPEAKRKGICRSYLCVYIQRGIIKRALECETCGAKQKIEAHHPDYSKPLSVRWLCGSCHILVTRGLLFLI